MSSLRTERLQPGDEAVARAMFEMMADVFEEPGEPLSDGYLKRILGREDFWAMAAFEGEDLVGAVTAHALPMTRSETSELFIYDLAVRADRQRRGIGRHLVGVLLERAALAGLEVAFVPADDEDDHALAFYRAIGGEASPVTFFTFDRSAESSDAS